MLVAREKEQQILQEAMLSSQSQFIAIYGRRRVGKTFLVREVYGKQLFFSHTGVANQKTAVQLNAFADSLNSYGMKYSTPANWIDAFGILKEEIDKSKEKKKIIFLDELSWIDTARSDFMAALEFFWNGWASGRKDIVLIVCASSTSWMINKVVHNRGGLHNRLTGQIHLKPFQLGDCEKLIKSYGLSMSRSDVLNCYMIMGGVPYYWSLLKKGYSLSQNIDTIFFADDAPLKDEYKYLYYSLFKNPEVYMSIVNVLGKKKKGLTRQEIIDGAKLTNSGAVTKQLEELELCGFIRKYTEFGKKKKDAVYQLIDSFTLFYYAFMEKRPTDEHFWMNSIGTPKINTWQGLAFERICMLHVAQIKKKMEIGGVLTEEYSWSCSENEDEGISGAQIDLLIYRKDQVINICEMKYSDGMYMISKTESVKIQNRVTAFRQSTKTRCALHPILVTTVGLKENIYSGMIQAVITMDDLFV
ncbi:hypothetical protein SAMN05421493_106102 [Pseudobutyrivibrio sp. 49]|uniref:AAA family ATPase n=1 Tax=Pseudobutyrivibrio sp. 49 TaxID=1855344 RepID=UPI000880C72D|nr:ATP-binding protein [Pseudobutyrivibrio sp. 49]SDH98749.1 hypothetical protein SAMN05421493_106102 [Pseudobutyrivibrio sp. 49]